MNEAVYVVQYFQSIAGIFRTQQAADDYVDRRLVEADSRSIRDYSVTEWDVQDSRA